MRLNLGSGERPDPDWVNLELTPIPGTSVVGDGTKLPFRTHAFEEVQSHHVIEHVFPYQWPILLGEMVRVLQLNGALVLSCPDFGAVAKAYTEGACDIEWARTTICGTCPPYNSVDYDDPASYHRTVHSALSLYTDLTAAGLLNVKVGHREWWNVYALGTRGA